MSFEIKDLCFAYNRKQNVLSNVCLSLDRGQIGVVLGKNGAGKSTLFKCVTGALKYKGRISFDGKDIKKMSRAERARHIAYVPQEASFGSLTVFDCVLSGRVAQFGFIAGKKDKDIARQVISDMGLDDLADREVSSLSGGERQKVIIARALAQKPELLVFDEPTGNLDIKNEKLLLDIVKKIVDNEHIAVLIAIHDLNFALDFGDRYYMMKDGEIKFSGDKTIVNEQTLTDVFDVDTAMYKIKGKTFISLGDDLL